MAHYRMLDRVPSAVITKDRNELKLYEGNIVYLNNGDNFELRFFNPLSEKIGVEIIFNGIKKGDSYLVLNPGQDIILDRFLDEQRKMLFETYTIDGRNAAAVDAIAQNGIINFNFYKEKKSYSNSFGTSRTSGPSGTSGLKGITGIKGGKLYSSRIRAKSPIQESNEKIYYDGNLFSDWSQDYFFPSTTTTTTSTTTTTTDIYYSNNVMDFSGDMVNGTTTSANFVSTPINEIETGRIEMGDISNQELRTVELKFESNPFYSMTYKMIPSSNKPLEITEIRQYCVSCGYRIRKQSWEYCPKCGEKII